MKKSTLSQSTCRNQAPPLQGYFRKTLISYRLIEYSFRIINFMVIGWLLKWQNVKDPLFFLLLQISRYFFFCTWAIVARQSFWNLRSSMFGSLRVHSPTFAGKWTRLQQTPQVSMMSKRAGLVSVCFPDYQAPPPSHGKSGFFDSISRRAID